MKTVTVKPDDITCAWYVVDASDKVLGRMATEIARRLKGKHKPEFTPNMDLGDHIVVINAEKVRVTGKKAEQKPYRHYSGFQGGLKTIVFSKLIKQQPRRIIETAVKGMLPKGPLGRKMLKKLHVYAGPAHQHTAQQPKPLDIK